jgi:hypothetical protein
MKNILSFAVFVLCTVNLFGQINFSHNSIRSGDEIVKQQVEYKDPGRSGKNVIWDFGKLKSINNEYTLTYVSPYLFNDSIYILGKDTVSVKNNPVLKKQFIIGTEHNTMYYFKQDENQLMLLGHENPTTLLQYINPVISMVYPFNYTDQKESNYQSQGLYSSRIPFSSSGQITQQADAFGVLVLPSGDTLKHVLRIKTLQTIEEILTSGNGEESTHINTAIETYKWYVKGYRYPVFETIRTINPKDSTSTNESETNEFATAFFFPPQEHLYLDNDKENLAVLDSLWNIETGKDKEIDENLNNPNGDNNLNFSYNFYPNPVVNQLTIDCYLEQSSEVNITIYSMDGKLMKTIQRPKQSQGMLTEVIDCNDLTKGTYILRIEANNKIYSNKLLKK